MRKVAVLVAAVAVTAACAAGPGTLTDRWGPMADARVIEPKVGDCYASAPINAALIRGDVGLEPSPCEQPHTLETFYATRFTGDVAARVFAPSALSDVHAQSLAECATAAREFLGGDWFTARTYLILTLPSPRHWSLGARHYRCDLAEVKSPRNDVVIRTSSLRDGLRGDRPLALGCANYLGATANGRFEDTAEVDCARPHDAEFVGVAEPAAGCEKVVARYVGASVDRIRVAGWPGDKLLRCYAAAPNGTKLTGSVKGHR